MGNWDLESEGALRGGLCGVGPALAGIVRCAGDSFVILQSCWHRNQLRAGFAVGLGSFSCV
jgi:hypothetical protein